MSYWDLLFEARLCLSAAWQARKGSRARETARVAFLRLLDAAIALRIDSPSVLP